MAVEQAGSSQFSVTCISPQEVVVIPFSNLIWAMKGMNGAANCLAGIDLSGERRIMCNSVDSPFKCKITENKEI